MTNTKARDEAARKYAISEPLPEREQSAKGWGFATGWDACLEHVLKTIGEFGSFNEHSIRNFASRELTFFPGEYSREKVFEHKMEAATIGARHQHDQIIKKIKAASSGETRVLSDKVARGSKGDKG